MQRFIYRVLNKKALLCQRKGTEIIEYNSTYAEFGVTGLVSLIFSSFNVDIKNKKEDNIQIIFLLSVNYLTFLVFHDLFLRNTRLNTLLHKTFLT